MPEITLPHQWQPRFYQRALWEYLASGGTRAVVNWHRRSGKDDVALHHTACAAHERVGNYWYMLPEYAQARKSMWDAINPHSGQRRMDEAFPVALRKATGGTNEQEMKVTFKKGSTFQLVGSDNFDSLIGSPPIGLVFSEYALSHPSAWGYLRPIVLENDGWVLFNSTPRGANHFKNLCAFAERDPRWFYQQQTVEDTRLFTDEQMGNELTELQAEHGAAYGKSLWLQEYYCSFDAAIPGAIWADCLDRAAGEGRIAEFAVNRQAPVYTAWDLGRTDDTAIWWYQILGRQIDIIDHFSASGMEIDNAHQPEKGLVQVLLARAKVHGVSYATHWLPHDARPRTLAAGGKSILQQFHYAATQHPELGRFAIGRRLDVQEGIQAARATFPYCRFHATRCAKGLTSLRHYHREWDAEKKCFLSVPVHDWSSHDSDAFRGLSLSWKFRDLKQPDAPLIDRLHAGNPVLQTFGRLKQQHFDRRRLDREWAMTP